MFVLSIQMDTGGSSISDIFDILRAEGEGMTVCMYVCMYVCVCVYMIMCVCVFDTYVHGDMMLMSTTHKVLCQFGPFEMWITMWLPCQYNLSHPNVLFSLSCYRILITSC